MFCAGDEGSLEQLTGSSDLRSLCHYFEKRLFIQTKAHGWGFEKVPSVLHVAVNST
jgi:hypothetical protein